MTRRSLSRALWLSLPAALCLATPAVQAQAFRCPGERAGQWLYTDQPCPEGALIAPAPTPQMQQQWQDAAEQATEREARRQAQALQQAQQRQAADWQDAQARALLRPQPHESAECRAARLEADFRARSVTATEEQIRTARYNAALACGQQPPQEVIVVQPPTPAGVVVYPQPYTPGYTYTQPYPQTQYYGRDPQLSVYGQISFGSPPPAPLPAPQPWPGVRPNIRHGHAQPAPVFGRPVQRQDSGRAMGIGPSAGIRTGMQQHTEPIPVITRPGRDPSASR